MKLPSELRAFAESLNASGVKYLIVDGYAVGFYGHPRFTGDIDFFIACSAENARAVVDAIDGFGFGSLGLTPEDFNDAEVVVQLGYPPNRIDLMSRINGVTFEEAWAARNQAELDGLPVLFISKELLVRNKKASNRPKDRADVDHL